MAMTIVPAPAPTVAMSLVSSVPPSMPIKSETVPPLTLSSTSHWGAYLQHGEAAGETLHHDEQQQDFLDHPRGPLPLREREVLEVGQTTSSEVPLHHELGLCDPGPSSSQTELHIFGLR
eukprot:CAMPEP_0206508578 /NCGR_PEP_ID=MMETSP0324_2-20121206/58426_1 /ASSEMBLY_ACC=CAM_ASM_000836 /TAXON_ID=2866 /ORGANISM="Crypthecodinium cohnii, Strain Seligo" /LENGTH=118 /DNA_ID=CAMNT_0053999489 /DNA_START=204 /DNA_END=560 /DNA_ORIENTATION=+